MTEPSTGGRGRLFWLSAAAGWVVIGYGLRGVYIHRIDTRPRDLATFALGGALLHDLLVAPLVIISGLALARVAPARLRGVVQSAAIVSTCLILFSYPLVRGYGHVLHNPSSLPHNYTANLLVVLGAVWLIAAAFAIRRLVAR